MAAASESLGPLPIVSDAIDAPMLPQYHPSSLIAQLNSGQVARVQRILGHVAMCIKCVFMACVLRMLCVVKCARSFVVCRRAKAVAHARDEAIRLAQEEKAMARLKLLAERVEGKRKAVQPSG